MKNELTLLINNEINPILEKHNGGCELVEIKNFTAYIKLTGSCTKCPGKKFTFEKQIVPFILNNIPDLEKVELV